MSIDWFTFSAQLINFLILVVLLHKFLYGPIVRAMQQREEKIAEQLQLAEQSQREGAERAQQYQNELEGIAERSEAILQDVRHDAELQRKRLMTDAREEVQRKRLEWFQAFEWEREELLSELQRRAGHVSAEAARRTLAQLANESLEQQTLVVFDTHLGKLDADKRLEIKSFLENNKGNVFLRTAFPVPEQWQDRLRATIGDEFGYDGEIDFELSEDLVCGIELEAGGYSLGWNVSDFMRNLAAEFDERLKTGAGGA